MAKNDGTGLIKETTPFVEQLCGKELVAQIIESALGHYNELITENVDEPEAMYPHTRKHIYPGIALFRALTESGVSCEQAAEMFRQFYRNRAEKPAATIRRLLKVPGLYRLIPNVFKFVVEKGFGEAAGFKAIYHQTSGRAFRADMVLCPYYNICLRYGCPEIVPAFCETDDVAYGNMHPKLIWGRTQTLGKGGSCCDFSVAVKD